MNTHLRISPAENLLTYSYPMDEADVVVCNDLGLISHYDTFSISGERSIFLLNTKLTLIEELQNYLPDTVKEVVSE